MPKLKSFDMESFTFPIGKDKKILFANNPGQKTYIKNRMDRMLTKEPETIKWINTFDKDSVFFDVGANVGIYSLYSAIVKQNKVYAFEPQKVIHDLLQDNVKKNKLKNVRIFNVGMGKKKEELELNETYQKIGFLESKLEISHMRQDALRAELENLQVKLFQEPFFASGHHLV